MATKKDKAVENTEEVKTPAVVNEAPLEAEKEETPKAEKGEAEKAKAKKVVNIDEKLANKGTFAVGVQAMMRDRIRNR